MSDQKEYLLKHLSNGSQNQFNENLSEFYMFFGVLSPAVPTKRIVELAALSHALRLIAIQNKISISNITANECENNEMGLLTTLEKLKQTDLIPVYKEALQAELQNHTPHSNEERRFNYFDLSFDPNKCDNKIIECLAHNFHSMCYKMIAKQQYDLEAAEEIMLTIGSELNAMFEAIKAHYNDPKQYEIFKKSFWNYAGKLNEEYRLDGTPKNIHADQAEQHITHIILLAGIIIAITLIMSEALPLN